MEYQGLAVIGALAALLVMVLILMLRPARADPALGQAIATLQAALNEQRERLGTIQGEIKAELARQTGEQSREFSGFAVEQTRHLTEGQRRQEEALETRLARDAAAVQTKLDEQRTAQADQASALRRDLGEATLKSQQLLAAEMKEARDLIDRKAGESRIEIEAKLKEMREANDTRLAEIQKSVNEQLQSAVEKQMNESFNRVIDQFAAVQKAMGDVQAVTTQIVDIKRLFSNVKTRGGWGEAQVKAVLDDILPAGSYETNYKLSEDSAEAVEFAIRMPSEGGRTVFLAVDAKFPIEDYDRLVLAADAGDAEGERVARRALEVRVRAEAVKIATKYIRPPTTVEFAVLYLPTEGLYAEIARIPGAMEEIGRAQRVLILGPSLLPAMLRTIQMGHVTIALGEKADMVRKLLGATKHEMARMDEVLKRLGKNVTAMANTIEDAQVRTRAVARKLRDVEAVEGSRAVELLELTAPSAEDDETTAP